MKLMRIAALLVLALALVAAAGAGLALWNQQRLVAAVLREARRRTGVEIAFAASRLEFRSHLIVVLERPRVIVRAREVATMARLRAAVGYHSILFTHGLPFYALTLERPALRLPFDAPKGGSPGLLRLRPRMVRDALGLLDALGRLGKRFDLVGLSLGDRSGVPLVRDAGLVVFHHRRSPRLWWGRFDAIAAGPPLEGLHVAANFRAGTGAKMPEHMAALGHLTYRGLPFRDVTIGSFSVSGISRGALDLRLGGDAGIEGAARLGLESIEVRGPELNAPLELGDSSLQSEFSLSADHLAFTRMVLRRSNAPVLSAVGRLDEPYSPNPRVALEITGLEVPLGGLAAQARALRRPPPWLALLASHVKGGVLKVESASVESPLAALIGLERETLLKRLRVSALMRGVEAALPAAAGLAPVRDLEVQLRYAAGTLSANQGSGRIGGSTASGLSARVDMRNAPAHAPYKLRFDLEADLAGLKPAILWALDAAGAPERDRPEVLRGAADAAVVAAGDLAGGTPGLPGQFSVRIEPRSVKVGFKGAPGTITLASGAATVEPGRIRLEKLGARATGGTADLAGDLRFSGGRVESPGLAVEMHQMPVERWLALVVNPELGAASGQIGGRLVIKGGRRDGLQVNGKLTLVRGAVQFGFLRSPMAVQAATATIHGHRLALSIPDARLEGEPINFELKVADLRRPAVRIDAVAQKLDLEAVRLVRMPWAPPSAPYVLKVPISGHVAARQARLRALAMSNAKTDFKYSAGDWRVYRFMARALGGQIKLQLEGRRQDDRIRIKGRIAGADAAALSRLNPKFERPPVNGRLDLDADLRADANESFFSTMRGSASVKVRNGNLDRFTLVSRLLALIDLKSWLTAQVPDPRVAGIPFRSLTGEFKGRRGVFHTDNLALDGPVMDILARGDIDMEHSTMAMEIGMMPFSTVNWLIGNIPLVGKNVAGGTASLLAAYFNVSGPIWDPSVTPAPITSVEELLKKTLALPLNIIRPDTVK